MADGNRTKPEDTANSSENSISKSKAEWLKPYPWPKGISGNPSGRPRKPITEAYADIADQKYPGDPEGRTYAQLIAEDQSKAAIKGKTDAAREIREALEGKTPQAYPARALRQGLFRAMLAFLQPIYSPTQDGGL